LVPLEQARETLGGIVDIDVAEHGPVLCSQSTMPSRDTRVTRSARRRAFRPPARPLELAEPDAGDLGLVVALIARLDPAQRVAQLAVRACDDYGSFALGGVPGHNPACARRLVFGVRVHRHQRQRRAHPASL
jgi:hypothetical protein